MSVMIDKKALVNAFDNGEIIAYPTEAVFGVGCDPDNKDAVLRLLALKQRPMHKGLILIAKDYEQVRPYVDDDAIPEQRREEIFASWPGPVTWLLPKKASVPEWLSGESDLIAIRISAHQGVRELCETLNKPLVSTSANLTGQPPAMSTDDVKQQLGDQVFLVEGQLGGNEKPSTIKHSLTGEVIRAG